jgi:ankyrin repeat protein
LCALSWSITCELGAAYNYKFILKNIVLRLKRTCRYKMEDIETDCAGYENQRHMVIDHNHLSSKKLSLDDHIDSDISIGYFSGEHNSPSLNFNEDVTVAEKTVVESKLPHIFSLENSLSKLNLSSNCEIKSDRCDSGLEDDKQEEYITSITRNNYWVSTHFSPEQILDIFRGDEDGDNHLHMSIIHGVSEVTMQIIRLAPEWDWLNQTNNLLQTPLHIAVITRQLLVVRRLMCAGASVDVRDQMGNTPLHNACRLGYEDVVRTLLKPIEYAETLQNKYDIPYQRLPQDLESRNYEGLTCFHLAAVGGHINVLRLLLDAGANVNAAEGKSGRTVLHFAVDWGNLSMIAFLLSQRDTDINARTYAGLTPILLAYGRRNHDLVDELFSKGALCESLSLSEDSDDDIADEKMADESLLNRPFAVMSH